MEFSKRAKRLRISMGLTQAELGERAQAHRATVQRWEAGKDLPSALTMARLADVFNVNLLYLIGHRHNPERGVYLAPDERRLLQIYRDLPKSARAALVDSAQDLLASHHITSKT